MHSTPRLERGNDRTTIVTDSRTSPSTDLQALATAPAEAMGDLYAAIAQSLANAAQNAATAQQQGQIIAQVATAQGIATLFSVDVATLGLATKKEIDKR
jgi:ubiquinone biosynthesis protein Coq4